jgi:hypothetical protein
MNFEKDKNNSTFAMIMDNKLCTLQVEFEPKVNKLKITPLGSRIVLNKVYIT